jgi:hypothetical protein
MGRTRVGGAAMHDGNDDLKRRRMNRGKFTGRAAVIANDKPNNLWRSAKRARHLDTPDIRHQYLVTAIHALGPRVLFELLDEIGRSYGIKDERLSFR